MGKAGARLRGMETGSSVADAVDVSIWMSIHVGDDATETDDLSPAEYGIHCRLRRALWRRGGVLEGDRSRLRRLVGTDSEADVEALDNVLDRLWKATVDDGITHPATMLAIEHARKRRASYQERGRKGGRPAKAKLKLT